MVVFSRSNPTWSSNLPILTLVRQCLLSSFWNETLARAERLDGVEWLDSESVLSTRMSLPLAPQIFTNPWSRISLTLKYIGMDTCEIYVTTLNNIKLDLSWLTFKPKRTPCIRGVFRVKILWSTINSGTFSRILETIIIWIPPPKRYLGFPFLWGEAPSTYCYKS